MRTITVFTLLLVMFSSFTASAQQATAASKSDELKNRVIIMTDEAEPFTVFLNDKKMTPKPGTKHVLDNLDRQSFNLKITFFKGAPAVTKKLIVKDGMEATYKLKKGTGKEFIFQLVGEKAIPKKSNHADASLTGELGGSVNAGTRNNNEKIKNRVIILTAEAEPFSVFLNDKKMTPKPGTKHVFEDLDRQSFNLKITFFKGAPAITKKLMVKEGTESTYELKKKNGKDIIFQLVEEKPLYKPKKKEETGNLMGGPSSGNTGGKLDNKPEAKTHNNRVIIYNDTNEPFSIFLNEKKQTPKPGTRHTLENLDRQSYNLKIDFFRNISSINKKLIVKEGIEATYKLKKVKEGEYVFQLEKERTLPGSNNSDNNLMGPQGSKKKSFNPHSHNDNDNVNASAGAKHNNKAGASLSGSASAHSSSHNNQQSAALKGQPSTGKPLKSTDESNSNQSSGSLKNTSNQSSGTVKNTNNQSSNLQGETESKTVINTNVNVSSKSCGMDLKKYRDAVISISNKSTDNAKLTIAKQVTDNYCLTSSQIKVIMEQFNSESTRLSFAKHAYVKCDDKNQFYIVNDAFKSEASVSELDKHIKKTNF